MALQSPLLGATEGEPRSLPFVTLDERLARAARREGLPVIQPGRPAGTR
jgi:hypothetical protein